MTKSKLERTEKAAVAPKIAPTFDNRRARHEYFIMESLEAGLELSGTEVKSLRAGGGISINEAYARLREGELWHLGVHIPPYKAGSFSNHDPRRPRKLLLHKRQIAHLASQLGEKGLTLVPLRLYFTRGKAKVEIGLAKGKKLWDKRNATMEREAKRDVARDIARATRR
jgi:SsrA-binding protein